MTRLQSFLSVLLLTASVITSCRNPVQSSKTVPLGLVAYYPFNTNAQDASGRGNHGRAIGVTVTTDRFGTTKKAYSFDGVDDYIEVPPSSSINLGSGDFTFHAWMKAQSVQPTYPQILSNRTSERDGFLFGLWSNGRLYFQTASDAPILSTEGDLRDNTWHQMVAVRNRGGVTYYIDGRGEGSYSNPRDLTTAGPLLIGWDAGNPSMTHFHGILDDIRIYTRALTLGEIQTLYTER